MSERLEARDVAEECVSWLKTAFGDMITVAPKTGFVRCVQMKYMIKHKTDTAFDPTILVGVIDSMNRVHIIAYPPSAMQLRFIVAGGQFTHVLPRGQALLVACLDVVSRDPDATKEFCVFKEPLLVERGRPEQECLHGYYDPSNPAYIKVILRTLMGLDNSHEDDVGMTPPHC
jgi:hypothetical protein